MSDFYRISRIKIMEDNTLYRIRPLWVDPVLKFFIIALMTGGAYSQNDITVQPGPVEVKQGSSVSLWCKLKYDSEKVVPVIWQSPPKFKTRTSNCDPFENVKDKYAMSCSTTKNPFGYYNITIKDIQWADKGEYRCLYTRHKAIVDLEVLVPVQSVSLTYVSNSTSTSKPPLFLSKGHDAVLTCTTECAYPAPKISWFENDQPFKGNPIVNITESDCREDPEMPEGQKRTISTVTVSGKYVDKNIKKANISCMAENVIGEEKVFSRIAIEYDAPVIKYAMVTTAMSTDTTEFVEIAEFFEVSAESSTTSTSAPSITSDSYSIKLRKSIDDDTATGQSIQAGPLTQAEIIGIAAGAGVGLVLILLGVACFFKNRRTGSQNEEEEAMNKKPPPPPQHV